MFSSSLNHSVSPTNISDSFHLVNTLLKLQTDTSLILESFGEWPFLSSKQSLSEAFLEKAIVLPLCWITYHFCVNKYCFWKYIFCETQYCPLTVIHCLLTISSWPFYAWKQNIQKPPFSIETLKPSYCTNSPSNNQLILIQFLQNIQHIWIHSHLHTLSPLF